MNKTLTNFHSTSQHQSQKKLISDSQNKSETKNAGTNQQTPANSDSPKNQASKENQKPVKKESNRTAGGEGTVDAKDIVRLNSIKDGQTESRLKPNQVPGKIDTQEPPVVATKPKTESQKGIDAKLNPAQSTANADRDAKVKQDSSEIPKIPKLPLKDGQSALAGDLKNEEDNNKDIKGAISDQKNKDELVKTGEKGVDEEEQLSQPHKLIESKPKVPTENFPIEANQQTDAQPKKDEAKLDGSLVSPKDSKKPAPEKQPQDKDEFELDDF